jgi:hypothetical protein
MAPKRKLTQKEKGARAEEQDRLKNARKRQQEDSDFCIGRGLQKL